MKSFPLQADLVSLAVTEIGAQLSDVTFTLPDGRQVAPMHTAPWADEALPADIPPSLEVLRGDFLCAPFSDSDVIAGETRGHGLTANGDWRPVRQGDGALEMRLDGDVMGAEVTARFELRPGHRVVYQTHVFTGGSGRLPVGHHAMLDAEPPLLLAFGPWDWAGTPPDPVERPPAGQSILAYPQEIVDLHSARLADGGTADLTRYSFAEGHEDIWMLTADRSQPFGWTAATSPEGGWVWFALKDPRVLPATVLWLSNGGRTYAPWNSRHRHVIGMEEVCSHFHLGHAASIADNPMAARGTPTAITLGGTVAIRYAFGLAPAPAGFGAVAEIRPAEGGVVLADAGGREAFAAIDLSHVTAASSNRDQA